MQFEIISADITKVAADAIVLPANPDLREGAGASAAIYAAAGRSCLAAACDEARKARGSLADGSAIATPAYDLPATTSSTPSCPGGAAEATTSTPA